MASSDLLRLLLATAAAASLLAPANHLHAQAGLLHTQAYTNRATSWTINLKADEHGAQHLAYMDGMSVSVFLLRSIHDPPQEAGLSFAVCFYCTTPCTHFYFGVCILHVDSGGLLSRPTVGASTLQVVWSANRGCAVRENATLSFTASGNLMFVDTDGSIAWSTGTSGHSVAGMILTKSGNLVLFNRNNVLVQQSFSCTLVAYLKEVRITHASPSPSPSVSNAAENRSTHIGRRRIDAGAIFGFTMVGVISLLTVVAITLVVCLRRHQQRHDEEDF